MISSDLHEIEKVKQFLVTKKEDGKAVKIDFSKVIPMPNEILESKDEDKMVKWNYINLGCNWVHEEGWEDKVLNSLAFVTWNGNGLLIIKKLSRKFPMVLFLLEYGLIESDETPNMVSIKNGKLHGFYHKEVEIDDKELKSIFPSGIC